MYHIIDDSRSVQSKNMIFRALAMKIHKKDFHSITIKEVVLSAQIGRSTFYRNFDSLEDVLLWKCDETFHDLYHYILQTMKSQQSYAGSHKFPFLLPFFKFWYKDSEIIELLVAANRIDMIFTAFNQTFEKFIRNVIPQTMNRFPHFDYFLSFRSGAIISILLTWIKNQKDLSPEKLCQFIEAQSEGL